MRFRIIGGTAAIVIVLLSGIIFAIAYDAPSCTDGKQNQQEEGIDCGGSCAYLCSASVTPVRVSFARALGASGRVDLLAYVENRNQAAEARGAAYTAEVFAEDGTLLGKREGRTDIPAGAIVPIFIPSFYSGAAPAARAFVSFDDGMRWSKPRAAPSGIAVTSVDLVPGSQPRVNAALANASAQTVYGQKLIVAVFDAAGAALSASQTVVREIPAQGTATATFTWNAPFPAEPAKLEVLPVIVLP